jgi:hypothetical protein|tara:strand:+ start:227 stop:691 length:465 start_codon:yes stop_codon:yes gene_type:complete
VAKQLVKLDDLDDYLYNSVEKLLRVVVFETDKRLKKGSPVDTGTLKASWQIGENQDSGPIREKKDYGTRILPPEGVNYIAGKEKLGNNYHCFNNQPYAEPVIFGTNLPRSWRNAKPSGWRSKNNQITKGYPDLIAKTMQRFVTRAYDEIINGKR